MLLSKFEMRDYKKLIFIEEQKASGSLSGLGIKNFKSNYFSRSFLS